MVILKSVLAFFGFVEKTAQDAQSAKDKHIGEQMQQGADLAAAQKVAAADAAAAANAPKTIQELEAEQNAGKV